MLGRKTIVDGNDDAVSRVGQQVAQAVVGVEFSNRPATTVIEDEPCSRLPIATRLVNADRNLCAAVWTGNDPVFDNRNRFQLPGNRDGQRPDLLNRLLIQRRDVQRLQLIEKSLTLRVQRHERGSCC